MDWESCTLTRYDNDYQNAKESLEGLRNIVFIAIAVVSIICFLVLALFLTLRLRGRVHEAGVYLTKECIVKERGHPENSRRHRGAGKDAQDGILEPDDPLFKKKCRELDARGAMYRVNRLSWRKDELPSEDEYRIARASLGRAGWEWTTSSPTAAPPLCRMN